MCAIRLVRSLDLHLELLKYACDDVRWHGYANTEGFRALLDFGKSSPKDVPSDHISKHWIYTLKDPQTGDHQEHCLTKVVVRYVGGSFPGTHVLGVIHKWGIDEVIKCSTEGHEDLSYFLEYLLRHDSPPPLKPKKKIKYIKGEFRLVSC